MAEKTEKKGNIITGYIRKRMKRRDKARKEKKVFSGLAKLPNGKASDKITRGCLILEGGALRGVYTSGVLDALMENDINLSVVVGVSAGALNGLNYMSGQIGRSARITLAYRHDSRYFGVKAIPKNKSIYGFKFLFDVYDELDPFDFDAFNNSERRFIAAATSCENGQQVYYEKGKCPDIIEACRASSAMQILSLPVEVDGEKCLDGGVSRRIPIQFAIDEKFDKIVVVRTRDREYRKKPKIARAQAMVYRKYPEFADALRHSNLEYNHECDVIEEMEKNGKLFQIIPTRAVEVGRLEKDMEKLGALYYEGYNDALAALPALKKYLEID
ncbi:MAG: patatin family protein [Lachnospiraceae bacterium]|nr:patatin family protein [Lachnospiraceae bacterium]